MWPEVSRLEETQSLLLGCNLVAMVNVFVVTFVILIVVTMTVMSKIKLTAKLALERKGYICFSSAVCPLATLLCLLVK